MSTKAELMAAKAEAAKAEHMAAKAEAARAELMAAKGPVLAALNSRPHTDASSTAGQSAKNLAPALLAELRASTEKPDLPIQTHAQRIRSGERGLSLEML